MGCSVSVLDDGSQKLVLKESDLKESVPVGVGTHAASYKRFHKQRTRRKTIRIDSNIVLKNREFTLPMSWRNQTGYDFNKPLPANTNIFQSNKRSGIKTRIKNQFFKGLGNLSLCSVLKDEFQEDCGMTINETEKNSSRIPKFTSSVQHVGQTSSNLQTVLPKRDSSISPFEKEASSTTTCFEDRMLGSLKNLSLRRSSLSLQSTKSSEKSARSSLTCSSNSSEALSVVYISDINSNLNSLSYPCNADVEASSNTITIKEIPTMQLMQSGQGIGNYDSLTIKSEEVAVAVHQDFFNGFGDDFDDDLAFFTSED